MHAAKARGAVPDAKILNALGTDQVNIGITDDGTIGLRLKLSIGMTLDVVLQEKAIDDLRSALDRLTEYHRAGGPKRAQ